MTLPWASISDCTERRLAKAGTNVNSDATRYEMAHFKMAMTTGEGGQNFFTAAISVNVGLYDQTM